MGILSLFGKRYGYLKRYNQVLSVMLKYGYEDLVSYLDDKKRLGFLKRLIPNKTLEHAKLLSKWERMRLVCEELGPTFVKFGQILSNRPDLLPLELIQELEKLQDGVPPESGTIALAAMQKELGSANMALFESVEPEAFASASMAQVHRAKLKTGENVVVKIQRPGIKEVIESDIKVMYYLAEKFSERIPSLKSFDPIGLVKNFEESILRELDFIHESVNIQRFQFNFGKEEDVEQVIQSPHVYSAFTTSKVLTMSFVRGIKISDTSKLIAQSYDPQVLAKRLAASYFKQVFNHGFFHADPHPGNLLVTPGNCICYLDFGMMGNILRKDLEALGSLFLAVNAKDVRRCIRAMQQLSDNNIIRNYRQLESDVNELVQNYSYKDLQNNELSTLMLELKDIIVNHGLKVPTHFFLLIRSVISIEGVIRQLDPHLDLTRMARPYLLKLVAKHYNPIQFARRVFNSVYEMGMYMEDFPRDLKNAMRRINTGEIQVDLRHKGIDPLVHTINRVTKQLVSAIVMAALIVGSSLLIIKQIHPLWGQTSAMGIVGLIVAGLVGLGLLNDLRQGDHDKWSGWKD